MGVCGGILFTVAHELLHGTHKLDLLLANVLLASVGYMHWTRSHLAHHVKVRRGQGRWCLSGARV